MLSCEELTIRMAHSVLGRQQGCQYIVSNVNYLSTSVMLTKARKCKDSVSITAVIIFPWLGQGGTD